MINLHDIAMVCAGGIGVLVTQGAFLVVRRALGLLSAAQRAEVLREQAERRAKDSEERLRLAECELSARGVPPREAPKRVSVRPL